MDCPIRPPFRMERCAKECFKWIARCFPQTIPPNRHSMSIPSGSRSGWLRCSSSTTVWRGSSHSSSPSMTPISDCATWGLSDWRCWCSSGSCCSSRRESIHRIGRKQSISPSPSCPTCWHISSTETRACWSPWRWWDSSCRFWWCCFASATRWSSARCIWSPFLSTGSSAPPQPLHSVRHVSVSAPFRTGHALYLL